VRAIPFDGGQRGRGAFGVNRDGLALPRVVDEQHGIAADAVIGRIHQRQHCLASYGRIKCIAAGIQDALRHQRSFGLHGGDCGVGAAHHRPHLPQARGRPGSLCRQAGDGPGERDQTAKIHESHYSARQGGIPAPSAHRRALSSRAGTEDSP
jgi:hypothetical protein